MMLCMCPYSQVSKWKKTRETPKAKKERGKRLLRRKLWQQARSRLSMSLKKLEFAMDGQRGRNTYTFAKDVARMYVALHGDPEDELHVGRKSTLEQAISAVFSEKDAGSLAYNGDLEDAMKEVHMCVLTLFCTCPDACMHVSLCMYACVLTHNTCVCPYRCYL